MDRATAPGTDGASEGYYEDPDEVPTKGCPRCFGIGATQGINGNGVHSDMEECEECGGTGRVEDEG